MVLTALRGALGFLSRLPVGRDEAAWNAFRSTPVAFPLVGYALGGLAALPLFLPLPGTTVALAFVAWLYLLAGINHLDGVADLGDALVVHGDPERRRAVMTDTDVGVGAVLAVGLVLLGLGLAGLELAGLPLRGLLVVVAAEVSAKLGMAAVVCLGTATHEGLGSQLTSRAIPRSLVRPAVAALPAGLLAWPHPAAAVALGAGVTAAFVVLRWARADLGGVSGDVIGATNEVARLAALHAGLVAWHLA